MQTSIDAINASYASLLGQEQTAGQERLGETRAVNARSGNAGSDFGVAATEKTRTYNKAQETALAAQKDAQIASVMQNIEDRADAEIASKKQDNLTQYQIDSADYEKAQESARSDLSALAQSGFDLSTMAPDRKAALFAQAGYADPDMGELVYNALKPKAAQIDWKMEKLEGGKLLFYGTDPTTGEVKSQTLNYDLPPDYQFTIAPDGTPIIFNKTTGDAQLAGAQGQFAKPDDNDNNTLLSPTDAANLGVPYGTTKGEAASLGIVPQGTADQTKAAGFAHRADDSLKIISDASSKLFGKGGPYSGKLGATNWRVDNVLPTSMQSDALRQYKQAAENFINAVLRRESGAAISDSEFERAYSQYMPQPGDSDAVIKQKLDNMQRTVDNFKAEAGPSWTDNSASNLFDEFEGGTSDPKE
jgi:hypothetical protein